MAGLPAPVWPTSWRSSACVTCWCWSDLAVAAGASGRASGLVVFCEANHPDQAALLKASADFYACWEEMIGAPSAITRVGGADAGTAPDVGALEREVAIMQGAGHDVRLVGRRDGSRAGPRVVAGDDIATAAYSPGSGYIDPPQVASALMNRARALGVRVYQGAEVRGYRHRRRARAGGSEQSWTGQGAAGRPRRGRLERAAGPARRRRPAGTRGAQPGDSPATASRHAVSVPGQR